MHGCHDDLGHLGTEWMLDLLPDWFYWSTMQDDVDPYLRGCGQCKWFKACPQWEELYPILATYPLQLVHIDFLTVENPKTGKDINVLVITDHFTWYMQVVVTTSQKARDMAKVLWDGFFMHYGFLASILSDQGWFVPTLVHIYNCTKSSATEFSPYYLMYGQKPRLGLDLQLKLLTGEQLHQAHHDYVSQLEEKLLWAYNSA